MEGWRVGGWTEGWMDGGVDGRRVEDMRDLMPQTLKWPGPVSLSFQVAGAGTHRAFLEYIPIHILQLCCPAPVPCCHPAAALAVPSVLS